MLPLWDSTLVLTCKNITYQRAWYLEASDTASLMPKMLSVLSLAGVLYSTSSCIFLDISSKSLPRASPFIKDGLHAFMVMSITSGPVHWKLLACILRLSLNWLTVKHEKFANLVFKHFREKKICLFRYGYTASLMPKMLFAEQPGAPVFKEWGWADYDGKPSIALSPQLSIHAS